jgi:secreted trypsin-like serine protease
VINLSRKFLIAAIGLTLAATSLHASAQQRIVGGSFVPNGSYKFAVSLQNSSNGHICTGSLITSTWVLTAAHCINNVNVAKHVRLGTVDATSGGLKITIKRTIKHPDFNIVEGGGDIALVELSSPATGITPLARYTANTPSAGASVRLLGWGQTVPQVGSGASTSRYLKQLDSSILASSNCQGNKIRSTEICIKGTSTAAACTGDSGGPAIYSGKLLGLTSRPGKAGFDCGTNTIYTNVTKYNVWISGYTN